MYTAEVTLGLEYYKLGLSHCLQIVLGLRDLASLSKKKKLLKVFQNLKSEFYKSWKLGMCRSQRNKQFEPIIFTLEEARRKVTKSHCRAYLPSRNNT